MSSLLYVERDNLYVGRTSAIQSLGTEPKSHEALTVVTKNDGDKQKKKNPPATAYKKRHRGCSYCILDIENAPIPEFPSYEEVVGVISMEDVIEELLQVLLFFSAKIMGNIKNGSMGLGPTICFPVYRLC